jgi:mannose-6-phosphate isomerase-like protein (cupin superfamily)
MLEPVRPERIAAGLAELWSPRVIAELDDSLVKVARVRGRLAWHAHEHEDELFYVLKGTLRIELEHRTVVLEQGDVFVVPKGTRHNPVAEEECLIMLVERRSTLHTGNEITERTRSLEEQLRGYAPG